MTKKNNNLLEAILCKSRLIVILPVVFGVLAAMGLFLTASYEIFQAVTHIQLFDGSKTEHTGLIVHIISATVKYLIGLVLLIFSFGIYKLVISQENIHDQGHAKHCLDITCLDDLKHKMLNLLIVVLVVSVTKVVLNTPSASALEILFMALSILALVACVFFIRKN